MRQYRCIRKYDHFLPILCTYVRAIPETQIGETVGIQAGINDQYANAYNFRLEKK